MEIAPGPLVQGRWETGRLIASGSGGRFQRATTAYCNWITPDGGPGPTGRGGFAAESGRYHLYVSLARPWAHRTLIFRALKGLTDHISVDVVHPDMGEDGWTLDADYPGATCDRLHGRAFRRDVCTAADPSASGRVTVPVLLDKAQDTIVSNESAEIIRMPNSAFDRVTGNTDDQWPEVLRPAIDAVKARIDDAVSNGVCKAGFATTQAAQDEAATAMFDALEWLEDRLSPARYRVGDRLTEADWRLFPTLVRLDAVYHGHFTCNRARLVD